MGQIVIPINLGFVNCYLLKTEAGFVLFDTGGHGILDKEFTNRRDQLKIQLDKAGCNSSNLKLVILTHGDNDHVCNAFYIREEFGAKIAIHKNDVKLVEAPEVEDFMESFQYDSLLLNIAVKFMMKKIRNVAVETINEFNTFTPDIIIDDKFMPEDYGIHGKLIHLPGHTPGSIAIITAEGDMIAGDTLANMKKPSIAVNAFDFKELKNSIKILSKYNINKVYPGHGTPFEFERLKY